jgi:hypothetical protein
VLLDWRGLGGHRGCESVGAASRGDRRDRLDQDLEIAPERPARHV